MLGSLSLFEEAKGQLANVGKRARFWRSGKGMARDLKRNDI